MKRGLIAVGLTAIVVAVGLGILPSSRGNAVLAQVAHAMANVKSAHLTGYEIHGRSEERRNFEVWLKHPAKFRATVRMGDGGLYEVADDRMKRVELESTREVCSATISPSKGSPQEGLFSLNWFDSNQMLAMSKMGVVGTQSTTLPDGRAAKVIELAGVDPDYAKTTITIDEATNLLVRMEEYRHGKLVTKIEHVDYNVELPDSMFDLKIPRNALVDDNLNPVTESPERKALKAAAYKKMNEENGEMIAGGLGAGNHCGAPRHSGLRFTFIGPGKSDAWYVMSRNAYYVLGKAIVTDSKIRGYKKVVEDGWLTAPYKPDRLPGTLVMRIDKPGDYREFVMPYDKGYHYFCVERVQNLGNGPLIIMDEAGGMTFYGEAKFYPQGKVYRDGQRWVNEGDIRPVLSEYDFAKADFGNLPASEIKAMKAGMEKHDRALRRYLHDQQMARDRFGTDAEFTSNFPPGQGGSDNYFKVDPEVGLTLYYIPSRDSIYVAGRARLVQRRLFWRTERIVENEEVEAPGPEYRRYYEKEQRELRQAREYSKYRENHKQNPLMFDEWLKQHPELD